MNLVAEQLKNKVINIKYNAICMQFFIFVCVSCKGIKF